MKESSPCAFDTDKMHESNRKQIIMEYSQLLYHQIPILLNYTPGYTFQATLLYTCEPIQQLGTTKSNSLFMTALLLSFGLSAAPIIFMIGR